MEKKQEIFCSTIFAIALEESKNQLKATLGYYLQIIVKPNL